MFFFFFQAEDGIRDRDETGVQTCALPISALDPTVFVGLRRRGLIVVLPAHEALLPGGERFAGPDASGDRTLASGHGRSEERRVGKECRARWAAVVEKKRAKWSERRVELGR